VLGPTFKKTWLQEEVKDGSHGTAETFLFYQILVSAGDGFSCSARCLLSQLSSFDRRPAHRLTT
jgi:hypothetical protein